MDNQTFIILFKSWVKNFKLSIVLTKSEELLKHLRLYKSLKILKLKYFEVNFVFKLLYYFSNFFRNFKNYFSNIYPLLFFQA